MSYKKKLFLYTLVAFIVYAIIIIFIQIRKEKEYQTEVQRSVLKTYTEMIEGYLNRERDTSRISELVPKDCRISLISQGGELLYDNILRHGNDHSGRPEITAARAHGEGYAIRKSNSTHVEYLYYAREIKDGNYIRAALPYVIYWQNFIQFDNILLYFVIFLFFITLLLLIFLADKFGKVMSMLSKFAAAAEKGNIDYDEVSFPDTASGEIGNKIISLYKQLEDSKLQTDKERERNRQLKQELSNNISHELKTPVSSIRGYLEILLSGKVVDEEKKHYFLERSFAQTLRLSDLINDVSLINKIEESSDLFHKEKVNLKTIADEAIFELQDMTEGRKILITNNLPEETNMAGNPSLVYAIFRNLIENALKYAGEDIEVGIDLDYEDEKCYYIVFYDTGCGVKPEYLEKIFDRFLRIDEGRSRERGGTGLGLSIVKHAVLFHHGTIQAQNREAGGLLFKFSLQKS